MKLITPCITFVDNAEEAVTFYIDLFKSVFGNSGEIARSHFTQAEIDAVRDIRGLPPELLPGPARPEPSKPFVSASTAWNSSRSTVAPTSANSTRAIHSTCPAQPRHKSMAYGTLWHPAGRNSPVVGSRIALEFPGRSCPTLSGLSTSRAAGLLKR